MPNSNRFKMSQERLDSLKEEHPKKRKSKDILKGVFVHD